MRLRCACPSVRMVLVFRLALLTCPASSVCVAGLVLKVLPPSVGNVGLSFRLHPSVEFARKTASRRACTSCIHVLWCVRAVFSCAERAEHPLLSFWDCLFMRRNQAHGCTHKSVKVEWGFRSPVTLNLTQLPTAPRASPFHPHGIPHKLLLPILRRLPPFRAPRNIASFLDFLRACLFSLLIGSFLDCLCACSCPRS